MGSAYGRDGTEAVGGLAEEATRLLQALQGLGWLRAAATGPGGPGRRGPGDAWSEAVDDPVTGEPAAAPSGGPCECTVCPVCRGLRALRGASPTAYLELADAAESFAAAVRELAGAFAEAGTPRREGSWG